MDDNGFAYVSPIEQGAVAGLLAAWKGAFPRCSVFALVPEAQVGCVSALQAAAREAGVGLCGAVFPAVVHEGRFVVEGVWLARMAMERPHALVDDVGGDPAVAAERIAATLGPAVDASARRDTLLFVFDATTPNISSILDALYLEVGGMVGYSGVNAGSETFRRVPCLFDGDRLISGGVLWLLLPGEDRAVVLHDYTAPAGPSIATASTGNRIASVDFRPAFDFYRDRIREQYGVELTRANFYRYAVEYPFAILLASGELVVRMPTGLEEDGSINCIGEVPDQALLAVVRAPDRGEGLMARALRARLATAGASRARLFFYCAGRRMRLGDASEEDLQVLLGVIGDDVAGALTLGEIGSIAGGAYPLFHNGAVVCVAWEPA